MAVTDSKPFASFIMHFRYIVTLFCCCCYIIRSYVIVVLRVYADALAQE